MRGIIVSICVVIIAAALLTVFTRQMSDTVRAESERIMHDAIIRALITCYAAEGSFPASLSHLEKHYGVVIDRERFIVHYEVMASNVMPRVTIIRIGN